MITASKLSGTPWHTEFIKMNENDFRRHKSRCKYYINEYDHCSYYSQKCIGSSHCLYYKELQNKTLNNEKNIKQKKSTNSIVNKNELHGEFKILYIEENEQVKYLVTDDIKKTPLFNEVLNRNKGDIFELNNVKMKIIWKNIYKFQKNENKNTRVTKF